MTSSRSTIHINALTFETPRLPLIMPLLTISLGFCASDTSRTFRMKLLCCIMHYSFGFHSRKHKAKKLKGGMDFFEASGLR